MHHRIFQCEFLVYILPTWIATLSAASNYLQIIDQRNCVLTKNVAEMSYFRGPIRLLIEIRKNRAF